MKRIIENVQGLDELGHGVHRNARRENRHGSKGDGVERPRLFVKAQSQILGYRTRPRAVIKRHHENAYKHHGGNGADPVEMAGGNAVLGARSRHANHFLRAQVGRQESQTTNPCGNRTASQKKICAGASLPFKHHSDAQHKDEIYCHDDPVNAGQLHVETLR